MKCRNAEGLTDENYHILRLSVTTLKINTEELTGNKQVRGN